MQRFKGGESEAFASILVYANSASVAVAVCSAPHQGTYEARFHSHRKCPKPTPALSISPVCWMQCAGYRRSRQSGFRAVSLCTYAASQVLSRVSPRSQIPSRGFAQIPDPRRGFAQIPDPSWGFAQIPDPSRGFAQILDPGPLRSAGPSP